MPKKRPEPFWRKQTKCYYVQIGKKQHRLDPDEATAWRLYHELMAKPPEAPKTVTGQQTLAVQVIDDFLEWVSKNRAKDTYDIYFRLLQRFASSLPKTITVSELKPFHVTRVMDANSEIWSNNAKNDFATTVSRCFNWGEEQGLIDKNPLRHLKKPGREAREMALKPADFDQVMQTVKEPNFKDLLELTWELGTRPQEIRVIEARHLDFDTNRIVFPPKEAKGKKRYRVIYLTDRAKEILKRLCKERPTGPVLLNSEGRPWTRHAINCAFCRLEEKVGTKFHLGAFRKGYATEALKAGVDTITLAGLLGHTNGAMLSRFYAKVQQDPEHMAQAAKRAKKR